MSFSSGNFHFIFAPWKHRSSTKKRDPQTRVPSSPRIFSFHSVRRSRLHPHPKSVKLCRRTFVRTLNLQLAYPNNFCLFSILVALIIVISH